MKSPRALALALAFCLLTPTLWAVTWTQIDDPNGSSTQVRGINTAGTMVGFAFDTACCGEHGFFDRAGVFMTIAYPGSGSTEANGINDNEDVVGNYLDSSSVQHGFVLQGQAYTLLDPPGATSTWAEGINNAGQIVGFYFDSGHAMHGFEFSGGTYTTIDVPGGSNTAVFGINNNGDVSGLFVPDCRPDTGFILSNGSYSLVNIRHSIPTILAGINDHQRLAGWGTSGESERGFTYSGGKFVILGNPDLFAYGINNSNSIVGTFYDLQGQHGFLRTIH